MKDRYRVTKRMWKYYAMGLLATILYSFLIYFLIMFLLDHFSQIEPWKFVACVVPFTAIFVLLVIRFVAKKKQ